MTNYAALSVFALIIVSSSSGAETESFGGTCSRDSEISDEGSCFQKSWSTFLQQYQRAKEDFASNQCAKDQQLHCDYDQVIEQDLSQFDEIT